MKEVTYYNKTYRVDDNGFLVDFDQWDRNFAESLAPSLKIEGGISEKHWRVINFIRDTYKELGRCPLVYQTCKMNGLHLNELKSLFPTGYLRGACRLAGITYREGYVQRSLLEDAETETDPDFPEKTYSVDVRGFLVNPYEWDSRFAVYKAFEMKMPERLTSRHWQIINYLRDFFKENNRVPTVYETCGANGVDIEELERLFPDGYHRGAVKIAGLRVR
jgi:tRNA 2-thiouridine synthesizing protein E